MHLLEGTTELVSKGCASRVCRLGFCVSHSQQSPAASSEVWQASTMMIIIIIIINDDDDFLYTFFLITATLSLDTIDS